MRMAPPLKPDDQRRKLRQVRMTDAEWALIQSAADAAGKSASDVVRDGGLREARKLLKAADA